MICLVGSIALLAVVCSTAIAVIALWKVFRKKKDLDIELYASIVGWAKFILYDDSEIAMSMRQQYADMAVSRGRDLVETIRLDMLNHNRNHTEIKYIAQLLRDEREFTRHIIYYKLNDKFLFDSDYTSK